MVKESNPGSTYFIAGRTCVSYSGGTDNYGCLSPGSLFCSVSPVLLQLCFQSRQCCRQETQQPSGPRAWSYTSSARSSVGSCAFSPALLPNADHVVTDHTALCGAVGLVAFGSHVWASAASARWLWPQYFCSWFLQLFPYKAHNRIR